MLDPVCPPDQVTVPPQPAAVSATVELLQTCVPPGALRAGAGGAVQADGVGVVDGGLLVVVAEYSCWPVLGTLKVNEQPDPPSPDGRTDSV